MIVADTPQDMTYRSSDQRKLATLRAIQALRRGGTAACVRDKMLDMGCDRCSTRTTYRDLMFLSELGLVHQAEITGNGTYVRWWTAAPSPTAAGEPACPRNLAS